MNINRRFYRFTKHKSYTSPYIPAQARTSNSVNMTSEQTSTQTTCANCCHVPTNANHFLHKMKLVYIVMVLLLQSLSYVVHLGDGSVYLCDSDITRAQIVETSTAVMRKGCTLRNTYVEFDLFWMRVGFYDADEKNPRAYGNNDGVIINISEAVFHNSPIILQNGYHTIVKQGNEGESNFTVPLLFTMSKCNLSGTSGLILCPDTDDICRFPRHSRIRIIHSNFNISIQRDVFDDDFCGVFTFGALSLAYSTIEIADNDITVYKEDNGNVMAVFYVLCEIDIENKSHFTIQNNNIYINGEEDIKQLYLWYVDSYKNSNVTISGNGSRMVWKANCVAMAQPMTTYVIPTILQSRWVVVNGGELLLDGNKFTTMTQYAPSYPYSITQLLLGWVSPATPRQIACFDNFPMIIDGGKVIIRNIGVLSNSIMAGNSHSPPTRWYINESILTSVSSKLLPNGMFHVVFPNIPWLSNLATNGDGHNIPTLDNSNLRRYMCAV